MLSCVKVRKSLQLAGWLGVLAIALLGCAAAGSTTPENTGSVDSVQGELSVFAAASLQPAFESIGEAFTKAQPGVTLRFTFDGSSVLATQLREGARADVFAAADTATMSRVTAAGVSAGDPTPFASSELVIAVTPGNPLKINMLSDLTTPSDEGRAPTVIVCDPQVPCGAAAQTLLKRDEVALTASSYEQNVTAVLTKVQSGEADAGLVYASDIVRSGGALDGIPIAESADAAGTYVIVPLAESASPEAAEAFVDYVGTAESQRILRKFGFGAA